jgi:pimeloyl-ACP methyl ester carboxylesterase
MQPSRGDNSFSPGALQSDPTPAPAALQSSTSDNQNAPDPGPVVFVGGAGDQDSAIVYGEYERFKFARPDIPSRYFSHDENRAISNYIKTLPDGAPVTLIGHSWGGDTAAQVALNLPKRITRLITVDPVGTFTPWLHSYDAIAKSVGKWTNINAQPGEERTAGDRVAGFGGRWGTGPAGAAHNFVTLNGHHDDFSRMLNQLNSYQTLINGKRAGTR